MQTDQGPRGHDLHRFLTFIDACIAIAVTLLVLPLIEAAGDADKGVPLSTFLDHHQSQFWSFLLSFAVIAQIWNGHHGYVSLVHAADQWFFTWVFAWTLCLVLLPVPTALISRYDSHSGIVPLYIGLLLANSLFSAGMATHVWRTPALWAPDVTAADVAPVGSWVMVGCYVVALAVGTLFPGVNFYALLTLVLSAPIARWWRARR
ncbi:MAG: conserved rane protein of unknown function [Marmoricola sp.]|nr:conserved rane protein of unknown function [Marmoricola sp.]